MAQAKSERRGLGRGLSALMADVDPKPENTPDAPSGAPKRTETLVDIARISANPDQPRQYFDQKDLDELAESVRQKGIIQPLIVRPDPKSEGSFQIVAGERRWRAAQKVSLHKVPVIIRDLDDTEVLELAIIENIQRSDLNPVDEARGYQQLMNRFGHTQEKMAEALGKSRSHIANMVRLLTLPEQVLEFVQKGALSMGHARALVPAENPMALAQQIMAKKLSVRDVEKLLKAPRDGANTSSARKTQTKDADTRQIEKDLSAALGMLVSIDHVAGSEKGKLVVQYKNLEQLDDVCRRLSSTAD
ncbi:MAG: ParB/RepB/Spo0J family partition protein [Pseudomonadota bacterium]